MCHPLSSSIIEPSQLFRFRQVQNIHRLVNIPHHPFLDVIPTVVMTHDSQSTYSYEPPLLPSLSRGGLDPLTGQRSAPSSYSHFRDFPTTRTYICLALLTAHHTQCHCSFTALRNFLHCHCYHRLPHCHRSAGRDPRARISMATFNYLCT